MSPYIKRERRKELDPEIEILFDKAQRVGELNYIITRILDGYILKFADSEGIDYSAINAIMGVLSCVAQEFYRKRAVVLENKKCAENGEVFL